MDLNQLKKIMEKERAKVIIVENGEPILVVSLFDEEQQQLSLERVDKRAKKTEYMAEQGPKIIQSTDLLTKEEMPADELTIEDLPF